MANRKNTILLAAMALAVIGAAVWASGMLNTDDSGNAPGFGDSGNGEALKASGDLFEGKITNKNVEPMKLEGVGVYDRNCVSVEGGLTNCHAGIRTSKYGVIDFNYVHDMAKKPCIASGQNVVVTILDSGGKATVQRVSQSSGMMH